MSLPILITSWLLASPAIAQEPKTPMEATEMRKTATGMQMTAEQQATLMHFTEIGLQWVAGKMRFDEVIQRLGKPEYQSEQHDLIEFAYFPDKVMAISFTFNKLHPVEGKPGIDTFGIRIKDDVHTEIPYERFDRLGLHRIVRGESIDGLRTEPADFFSPSGRADVTRTLPENYVTFNYRLLLPPDSLFDIYMGIDYLGEWRNPDNEPTFRNLHNAVDLRGLSIGRYYLPPEQLQRRQQAKRQKYGEMNLYTGMICPETGLWEGWSQNGPTGQFYLEAGRRFPDVRTIPAHVHWYCEHVPGRWMWLKEDDLHKTLS
ncbi:hypothetical protein WL40_14580 [Burkholderia ubonensis]|uniref:hypothetical protein n=1 Tax=Burkholderia ubonensis TaxID=101571 RepID=UPI0007537E32|nr:hypothetical protein [Burkholderia ubonensis]KVP58841.1 hypothetical protein WJ92_09775 [Burkholderia ubonensis]KWB67811.1 hypothetical protein WL40_14580 [Burkholderia ubonensis]